MKNKNIKDKDIDGIVEVLDELFQIEDRDLCNFQLIYREELNQEDWSEKEVKEQMFNDIAEEILTRLKENEIVLRDKTIEQLKSKIKELEGGKNVF